MKNPFTDRLTIFLKRKGVYTEAVLSYWKTQADSPRVLREKIPIDTINSFSWDIIRSSISWSQLFGEYYNISSKNIDLKGTLYELVD